MAHKIIDIEVDIRLWSSPEKMLTAFEILLFCFLIRDYINDRM